VLPERQKAGSGQLYPVRAGLQGRNKFFRPKVLNDNQQALPWKKNIKNYSVNAVTFRSPNSHTAKSAECIKLPWNDIGTGI
jgi:hypothetical protein